MPILSTRRRVAAGAASACVAAAGLAVAVAPTDATAATAAAATTPIQHVVVIFDENVSYDHYFGTYPKAANTDGTTFVPITSTPATNNLTKNGLLTQNPNSFQPTRLTPAQAVTCDQNHNYGPEQKAFDGGAMDKFPENVSVDTCSGLYGAPGLTMDYYDGNTVTGLWNYAQQFSLSDNSFDSNFGPSTPGALNLISGQTHGFVEVDSVTGQQVTTPGSYTLASPGPQGIGTIINDPDPAFDDCADKNHTSTNTLAAAKGGKNIGDLLNAKNVTWGWFQGGFDPTTPAGDGTTYAVCGTTHTNIARGSSADYSPHHNPFAYYQSTSNPHHLPPTSEAMIGKTDQANHQYDLSRFDATLTAGNMPAVSFLKAPEYQDGHAGYSDPIDEQNFLVSQINAIQKSKFWKNTAIVIAYDDSDGWYDHVAAKISNASKDSTNDTAMCSSSTAVVRGGFQDRCGPGPRLPLLVLSPFAKTNYVDHTQTEQASVLRFIENNWDTGRVSTTSFDNRARSLDTMFDFSVSNNKRVILAPNGSVQSVTPIVRTQPVRAVS